MKTRSESGSREEEGRGQDGRSPASSPPAATLQTKDRERIARLIATALDRREQQPADTDRERGGEAHRHAPGVLPDVFELRDIVKALYASEQLFTVAFRSAPHAASIARASDGRFIDVNDKYEKFFGWKRDELIGRTSLEVGLWPDEKQRRQWLATLEREGTLLDYESVWEDRLGRPRQVSLSAEYVDLDGEPHIFGFIQDISERKEAAARIDYLAHHDALTGLPNRALFRDRFALTTAWAEQTAGRVALLFLDLDHFKTINDTLGHPTGDRLLKLVSERLRDCIRETDTVSRIGGDEFLIAINDVHDASMIDRTNERILDELARPFEVDGRELTSTLSIGIAVWPEDGADFDTLLKHADTALHQAKSAGRNTCRFYTERMNADALERLQMRTALRHALERSAFELHYQPQIELASGRVRGVEALLRWRRDDRETVSPASFIPEAEESGLIVPIGDWVLREACAQAVRWQACGLPEMTVAVNLSAVQFRRGDLERSVTEALGNSGLAPERLELELTESLLLDDADEVLATVRRLKAIGVQLSIDDFGTGYSSLAYLKRFAVDRLKIDQSFVRDVARDPEDAAIVRAIVSMAHTLKLDVVAEGVESGEIARLLAAYGCDSAQGYFYARPMPAEALGDWLHGRFGH